MRRSVGFQLPHPCASIARIRLSEEGERPTNQSTQFRHTDVLECRRSLGAENSGAVVEELMKPAVTDFLLAPVRGKEIRRRLRRTPPFPQKDLGTGQANDQRDFSMPPSCWPR